MKSRFINVLMFAAGAAIGSAVTWKIVKTQYDRIVQEELDSIREAFGEDNAPDESAGEEQSECEGQINWDELEDLKEEMEDEQEPDVDRKKYEKITNNYKTEKGGSETMAKEPYVISPYDFGELDEYHQIELTYYADGILEDDEYNIVTDVEELIGRESLFTFGEYEDDSVFVRNEHLSTDFQILKDYRTYAEARSVGPNRVDNE